jgi:hypothetical protein
MASEPRKTFAQRARKSLRRAGLCAIFAGAVAGSAAANPLQDPGPTPVPVAHASVAPAPPPLLTPVPAVPAPTIQMPMAAPAVTTPPEFITPSPLIQDTMTPEACAANDDLAAVSANTPELSRDLAIMDQLPLTGRGVYDMLKDPANNIESCLYPVPAGGGTESTFQSGHARIGRGTGTSTAFHEWFHAWQTVQQGGNNMFSLKEKDALADNLLKEASAVAYEIASRREAENHKLSFAPPSSRTVEQHYGPWTYEITYSAEGASDDANNKKAFDDAYAKAFAANPSLSAQDREKQALEAGGQAVVRRLLSGADVKWASAYAQLATENVNNNLDVFDYRFYGPDYPQQRATVFSTEGTLASGINFVPPEYLGDGADAEIDKALAAVGISLDAPPAPQTTSTPTPPQVKPAAPGR